jgi:hypothetical protein
MSPQKDSLPPLDPLRRYPIVLALRYLDTSRKTLYAMIARGEIRTITQGDRTWKTGAPPGRYVAGRRYVPGSEIQRLSSAPSA